MFQIKFQNKGLSSDDAEKLQELRKKCVQSLIEMTTLAGCGHPGGSLSTLDFLLVAYSTINHTPDNPANPLRDRMFISHGHITPAVYPVLGTFGYFDLDTAIVQFRKAKSSFGGHVEHFVPGVEWNSGNLGQGLSSACASALTAKLRGENFRALCCMGDGEQQKGQISEARRFARKYKLSNLIGFVDWNGLQIGGATEKIMAQNLQEEWEASGWNVLVIEDGHDYPSLYTALRKAYLRETEHPDRPTVLLAKTIMGKGISWMEGKAAYHGKTPSLDQAKEALAEIGAPDRMDELLKKRARLHLDSSSHKNHVAQPYPAIQRGEPVVYKSPTDCRSAYGKVLEDLAKLNNQDQTRVLALTCDLEGSVKMQGFHKISPEAFLECGIQEHNTAVLAGRLSSEGFCVFFSTFGVFGGSEVYNQQRLNDYNKTNVKVVCTHCGIDVGEDGPTHQCLDYISLFSNLFSFSIFCPADPNQCDSIIRHIAEKEGNFFVAMGRSKMDMITREDGSVFFDKTYSFQAGKADLIRSGDQGALLAFGPTVHPALKARKMLKEKDIEVRVVNMASLKPLDVSAVLESAKTGALITVEDHHCDTGLGSLVARTLADHQVSVPFLRMGLNHYSSSGKPAELFEQMGLDGKSIAKAMENLLGR